MYQPWIENEPQEVKNQIMNQWVMDYQKRLDLVWKCLMKAQKSICSQMKRTPTLLYKAGQHVWLLTKSWQPQILKIQWISLFKIQEVLHNTCQLHLPLTLKIHPVVNVAFLKHAAMSTSLDLKHTILSNPQEMANKKWDIMFIIAHKYQGKQLLFKVWWKGYGLKNNT